MRPKVTFRDASLKRSGWGIASSEDADEPNEADMLATWRGKYERFMSQVANPSSQSVKETLRQLAMLPDDQIDKAIKHLDPATTAELKRTALLEYRSRHPCGICPSDVANLRNRHNHPTVQELAVFALDTYPFIIGNQNHVSGLDHLFAVALVLRWNSANPTDPARIANPSDEPTRFQDWAWEMFSRIGRRSNRESGDCLTETSLTRILSTAISEVKNR